ncbi:MAG: LysR substrate-binding domain-containing protein [Edaphobacter sp.]
MSTTLEVRYYEAVVALAQDLNYARAADRLDITQPALTKQIMELEKRLGYLLFDRDKKHVAPTLAGEAFIQEARLALIHAERAVEEGRAVDHGREHVVRVGRSQYADPDLISSLFAVSLPLFPNLKVTLESAFAPDLLHSVANGELDMAVVSGLPETRGITQVVIASTPLHVGLRENHPAAHLDRVHLRDLSGSCWAVFVKRIQPHVYRTLFQIAEEENVDIGELHHIMSVQEALPLVSEHNCVAFITESTARRTYCEGVVFRPLAEGAFLLQTSLIMRGDNQSRLINAFVRSYLKQFQRKAPQRELFDADVGSKTRSG